MSEQLRYTVFQDVLFPVDAENQGGGQSSDLKLSKVMRFLPPGSTLVRQAPIVLFDFETTGLDSREDRIIEIGAQKVVSGKVTDEFSCLVNPGMPISDQITKITGITNDMLSGQPEIAEVIPQFLQFIEGCFLVAHNAEFDVAFLYEACQRLGYQISWPAFCTLKLSRVLLPQLESRTLDALAQHYQLTFEARHRSVGDVKVTKAVLDHLLNQEGAHLQTWDELQAVAGVKA